MAKSVEEGRGIEACRPKKIEKRVHKEGCTFSFKKEQTGKEITVTFPIIRASDGSNRSAVPVFRRDRRVSTPGFGLPDEFGEDYFKEQQAMHQLRVNDEIFEIPASKIMQPKPSIRNSYCTICKVRFEDYKDHIAQAEHLLKMRQSPYNEFINSMCQAYAMQTGRYMHFCDEESGETLDRRDIRERRKNSEETKEKLYAEIKEELARSTRGSGSHSEEIYDVIDIMC